MKNAATVVRSHARDEEHRLQTACVSWFRLAYPKWAQLLFAVPNGGRRDAVTGARLKAEGVVPGVSDLLLLVPAHRIEHDVVIALWHGFCIEMKTLKGRQTENQKAWQRKVEAEGYRYEVVRTVDEFMAAIDFYMEGRLKKNVYVNT